MLPKQDGQLFGVFHVLTNTVLTCTAILYDGGQSSDSLSEKNKNNP